MGSEQQFCLRWNNHQSTLISVFDTLLESETLVDVTLAAEGQYLKAHKVVLSACSQYFQELLCHHIEKHPIIILKDVTFQELKALIDYMYRGEVNVSQEQLSALIKTAESLKIKGLADGGDRRPDRKSVPQLSPPLPPVLAPSGNLSLDGRGASEYATNSPLQHVAREGSISPVSRKRKRIRRRSGEGGGGGSHEADVVGSEQASSSASTISVPNIPATITPVNSGSRTTPGEGDEEEGASGSKGQEGGAEEAAPSKQSKSEPGTSLQSHSQTPLLEPKSEYREEDEDDGEADEDSMDNVVALEEDVMDMEGSRDDGLDQKPGPSHGAEVSGQGSGFAPWHMMPDRSGDDIFIPSQESAAQRESQESLWVQPPSTSPSSWKITSVESGNLSFWLEDAEPRDTASRSSQERDCDVVPDNNTKMFPAVGSVSVQIRRNLFQEESSDLILSNRGIAEKSDKLQTCSNSGRFHTSGTKPKTPFRASSFIPSDLYCEPMESKRRRGRPSLSVRRPQYVSGRAFARSKKGTNVIPFPLFLSKTKRSIGRPRKETLGSSGSCPGQHTLAPESLKSSTEVSTAVTPLISLISFPPTKIKRPVGRPRKETLGFSPESDRQNTPVPKKTKVRPSIVPVSVIKSISGVKIKRPVGRPRKETLRLLPGTSAGLLTSGRALKCPKSKKENEDAATFRSVSESASATNMKRPVGRPRKETLGFLPGASAGHSRALKCPKLKKENVAAATFRSVSESASATNMKRPVGRPRKETLGLLPGASAGHSRALKCPKLKKENEDAATFRSVSESASATNMKRPVGRPRKETLGFLPGASAGHSRALKCPKLKKENVAAATFRSVSESASATNMKRPVGRPRKETLGLLPGSGLDNTLVPLKIRIEGEPDMVPLSANRSASDEKIKRPVGRPRKERSELIPRSGTDHFFFYSFQNE